MQIMGLEVLVNNFSIEELRHIFDAVEQHIYERKLGELNDLRGKILNNIKGGQNA